MDTSQYLAEIESRLMALKAFRGLDSSMPAGQIAFFLNAAKNEGLSISEISTRIGANPQTTSRYLKNLSDTVDEFGPGLGLLYSYKNPKNRRQKLVVLTAKGHAFLKRLKEGKGDVL